MSDFFLGFRGHSFFREIILDCIKFLRSDVQQWESNQRNKQQLPSNENLLRHQIASWRHLNEPYRMNRTLHNNWPLYRCLRETECNLGLFNNENNGDLPRRQSDPVRKVPTIVGKNCSNNSNNFCLDLRLLTHHTITPITHLCENKTLVICERIYSC